MVFAAGLLVGGWRSEIVRTVKVWLGSPDDLAGNQGPYYRSKLAFFRQSAADADVIMLGDSITEGVDWRELFPDLRILNRGISGDTSAGVLNRLDEVIARHPKVVFLMIGSNDLQMAVPVSAIKANIKSTMDALEQNQIRVVLQKVLYATAGYRSGLNDKVNELNDSLSDLCGTPRVLCLNLNQILAEGGALSPSLSTDGLHLNTSGYLAWKNEMKPLLP